MPDRTERARAHTDPPMLRGIISALAVSVVGAYAAPSSGHLGRWWLNQSLIRRSPWLR